MRFDTKGVKAEVMGSMKPKGNGPQWKALVQKENEQRRTVLTYESLVGGKCKHGENETSSEDSELKKKGTSYCCTFRTQIFFDKILKQ